MIIFDSEAEPVLVRSRVAGGVGRRLNVCAGVCGLDGAGVRGMAAGTV